jgi:hypothetical protein
MRIQCNFKQLKINNLKSISSSPGIVSSVHDSTRYGCYASADFPNELSLEGIGNGVGSGILDGIWDWSLDSIRINNFGPNREHERPSNSRQALQGRLTPIINQNLVVK